MKQSGGIILYYEILEKQNCQKAWKQDFIILVWRNIVRNTYPKIIAWQQRIKNKDMKNWAQEKQKLNHGNK